MCVGLRCGRCGGGRKMLIDKMRVRDVICAHEMWETATRIGCVCVWAVGVGVGKEKEGKTVWHGLG